MKTYDVLIRFKTEAERHKFKVKTTKQKLTYRQAINEWVNQ